MSAARTRFLAMATLILAACASEQMATRTAPEFAALRARGLRIAVAPFSCSAAPEGAIGAGLAPLGDALAFQTAEPVPHPDQLAERLRSDTLAWLQLTDFEVVDPWHAATRWTHAGFSPAQQQDPAAADALAHSLQVDAVLFGEVERWDRSYYVVQSHAAAAVQLRLIDAAGRELCRTRQSASVGTGLTGGPTGYVSLATEPLAGLRTAQLLELLRQAARNAVTALAGGSLGDAPQPNAPQLMAVAVAQPHARPFAPGERLELVAIGTPGCTVHCHLGRLRTAIALRETARHPDPRGERATYQGHYVVQAGDRAAALPVLATIERGVQRRSVRTEYRWQGQVTLGEPLVAGSQR